MKVLKYILLTIGIVMLIWFALPLVTFGVFNAGNMMGMLFSAAFIIYGACFELINNYCTSLCKKKSGRWIISIFAVLIIAVMIFVIASSVKIISASHNPPDTDTTVVVLGCQVRYDGPSLSLYERLVAAYDFLNENEDLKCVLSGGQGSDEPMSEAECMYNWLVAKGIDPDRLYMEDKSTSTDENLLFTKQLIKEKGLNPKITIITNDFHQYRASKIASELGMESYSVSGKTHPILFTTYFLREIGGVLYELVF